MCALVAAAGFSRDQPHRRPDDDVHPPEGERDRRPELVMERSNASQGDDDDAGNEEDERKEGLGNRHLCSEKSSAACCRLLRSFAKEESDGLPMTRRVSERTLAPCSPTSSSQ